MAGNATGRERDPQVIRIAGFVTRSAVNGPGIRSVVWVQGCPIRCEGCFNPALWDPAGGKEVGIDLLVGMILDAKGIDGISLTGGEPFLQAGPLANLAEKVQSCGLSVLTFSGFPYNFLVGSGKRSWKRLIEQTDLLVSGPYLQGGLPDCPAACCQCKEIHDLTGRICVGKWTSQDGSVMAEYIISPDGTVTMTGYPNHALAERFYTLGIPGEQ